MIYVTSMWLPISAVRILLFHLPSVYNAAIEYISVEFGHDVWCRNYETKKFDERLTIDTAYECDWQTDR